MLSLGTGRANQMIARKVQYVWAGERSRSVASGARVEAIMNCRAHQGVIRLLYWRGLKRAEHPAGSLEFEVRGLK